MSFKLTEPAAPLTENYIIESGKLDFIKEQNALAMLSSYMKRNNCWAVAKDGDLIIIRQDEPKKK